MIGRTLAHYTVLAKIGEGGMGEVYRATDIRLKRDVALKVLPASMAADPDRLARFQREAEAVAALNHPNIVTLFSVEEVDGVHILIMELVEGESLYRLIPQGGFPVAELLRMAIPLADALSAAHDAGIVHRDLKPANVMVTRQGQVKVLDFGLAKIIKVPVGLETSSDVTSNSLTGEGMVVGTVPYLAPELLRGETADTRSDLFSFGVVLYELASGVRPFRGGSAPEAMASILNDRPVPLTDRRPDLPQKFWGITQRCLSKERGRRYQTAWDVRNDLEDLQRGVEWGGGTFRTGSESTTVQIMPDSESAATPPGFQTALTAYRESRIREWSQPRYKLDREFVALTLLVDQGEETASGRWSAQPRTYRDLGEMLDQMEDPAVVVLGSPGCGKSTLLRRLELETAQRGLTDPGQPMTFFIQLNQYKGRGKDPPPDPETWLSERWSARYPGLPGLPDLLRSGRMILLLDALNEMPILNPAALHEAVLGWKDFLGRVITDYPGTRLVFSCRTLDYSAPLSTPQLRVPQVVVEPLTNEQVEQFLAKQSPDQGAMVWGQLKGTPQLELMRSPYFLSLLTDQVEATGEVPEGRAGLFTGFVRQALRREVERGNSQFSPDGLLTERDIRRITQWKWRTSWELPERGVLVPKLSVLALAMQSKGGGGGQVRVGYDDALQILDHDQDARIVKAGLALAVLDEDPGTDEVLYVHQLVQEYFAGRELARTPDPQRVTASWRTVDMTPPLEELIERLPPGEQLPPLMTTGWEETVILGAAMTADPDAYVNGLLATNVVVAGRAAGQMEVRTRLAEDTVATVRRALVVRSTEGGADLRSRIEAGLALGVLGDPRFEGREGPHGKYLLPPLVAIPGGRFPMGEDEVFQYLGLRMESHMPRHEVEVSPFRIGKYPVTNAEWRCFMEAGGYQEERWWNTEGARQWRGGEGTAAGTHASVRYWLEMFREDPAKLKEAWRTGQMPEESYERWKKRLEMSEEGLTAHLRELYPGGELREPAFWHDVRFNNPLQPVVGVSWYEARAYTNWLSAQTGEEVRLPMEPEWEAAARGKEGRRYAWGDEFRPLSGNTAATKVGRTTPVGVFVEGETPEGVSDLTGNVEEWTGSLFGGGMAFRKAPFAYPYDPGDGRENPEAGPDIRRVLRGGAWDDVLSYTRAAARNELLPAYRYYGFGFRVVLGSSPVPF